MIMVGPNRVQLLVVFRKVSLLALALVVWPFSLSSVRLSESASLEGNRRHSTLPIRASTSAVLHSSSRLHLLAACTRTTTIAARSFPSNTRTRVALGETQVLWRVALALGDLGLQMARRRCIRNMILITPRLQRRSYRHVNKVNDNNHKLHSIAIVREALERTVKPGSIALLPRVIVESHFMLAVVEDNKAGEESRCMHRWVGETRI